jgi:hypothetical protein
MDVNTLAPGGGFLLLGLLQLAGWRVRFDRGPQLRGIAVRDGVTVAADGDSIGAVTVTLFERAMRSAHETSAR